MGSTTPGSMAALGRGWGRGRGRGGWESPDYGCFQGALWGYKEVAATSGCPDGWERAVSGGGWSLWQALGNVMACPIMWFWVAGRVQICKQPQHYTGGTWLWTGSTCSAAAGEAGQQETCTCNYPSWGQPLVCLPKPALWFAYLGNGTLFTLTTVKCRSPKQRLWWV